MASDVVISDEMRRQIGVETCREARGLPQAARAAHVPGHAGDALPELVKGKVSRKWQEGGRKLATIDVWTENEEGRPTTPGEAIVEFK